jgi:glycerol uptake operon antiterminator
MNGIIGRLGENPIIADVRDESDLDTALESGVNIVFILKADIFNIVAMVERIRRRGKEAFVHLDFLEGLGKDHKAIDYIAENIKPDGIITTSSSHVKYAKQKGLFTIQRFFMVDSLSYETTIKTVGSVCPDMVEIMPGVIPGVLGRLNEVVKIPVIAGGLVTSKDDIIQILKAGAIGVSTARKELWLL